VFQNAKSPTLEAGLRAITATAILWFLDLGLNQGPPELQSILDRNHYSNGKRIIADLAGVCRRRNALSNAGLIARL
jgi:hypothetical protein